MSDFLTVLAFTSAILGLSVLGMAIGLILRGRIMRGGCGAGLRDEEGNDVGCEQCSRKKTNLCDEDDEMGLSEVSLTSTFGRFDRKHG